MLERVIRRWVNWVLDHPKICVLAMTVVTALACSTFVGIQFRTTLAGLFFGDDHAEYNLYQTRTEQFGSDETVIIGIESEQPFAPTNLKRLKKLHEELGALDFVHRVISIGNTKRVGLNGDTIAVRSLADEAIEDPTRADAILAQAKKDPLIARRLVAGEKNHFTVVIEYKAGRRSAEGAHQNTKSINDALANAGYQADKVWVAGGPSVMAALIDASYENLRRVLPIVFCVLLIAVFLMFGRFWPVVVTTISAILAVVWTMGFALYQDPFLNIMMTLVPALVLIISFSDVVHICSAYLLKIDDGMEKRDAVVQATTEVGHACFLTSITTAVGFISMAFVPTPMFRRVGTATALGVCIAYLIAMVVVPLVLVRLKKPTRWTGGSGRVQGILDRFLDLTAALSTKRPWLVIIAFAFITGGLLWGGSKVEIETVYSNRLDEDNRARKSEEFLRTHFVNSTQFEVYIEADHEGGLLDGDFFNRFMAFQKEIESWPEVGKVVSIGSLLETTHSAIVGDSSEVSFLPTNDAALAQLMLLLEQDGPETGAQFIDFSRTRLRMTIMTAEPGIVASNALRTRVEAAAAKHLEDAAAVDALGLGPLMGAWVAHIVDGQKRGLLFSLTIIMIILVISFRSIRVGVLSMIPNVFPLLAILGWVGWNWDKMDSDMLIVMMIAVGIGVDDTIHFISRFRLESTRYPSHQAILNTFRYSGRGIAITTFVFVVGFAPLMTGDYFTIEIMGFMLPYCFLVALVADLLLLPAMAEVGWIKFPDPTEAAEVESAPAP